MGPPVFAAALAGHDSFRIAAEAHLLDHPRQAGLTDVRGVRLARWRRRWLRFRLFLDLAVRLHQNFLDDPLPLALGLCTQLLVGFEVEVARALDPRLLADRIRRKRIARPDRKIRILAFFERAGALVDAQL